MTDFDYGILNLAGAIFGGLMKACGWLGLLVLILAVATAVQLLRHRQRLRALKAEWRAEHVDAAGRPLPPAAPGLCEACKKAFDKVYYLPSGRRLCEACYRAAEPPAEETAHGRAGGP